MIQNFSADISGVSGKAQLVATGVKGFITVWGLAPFWISDTPNVQNTQPSPDGGFNIELRDGIYIAGYDPAKPNPLVLPWNGSIYVLNGGAAGDSKTNAVFVMVVSEC